MKNIFLIIILMFVYGCKCVAPEIVPNNTQDNLVILAGKDRINQPGVMHDSYAWLWWYIPICIISVMWAVKTFSTKNKDAKNNTKNAIKKNQNIEEKQEQDAEKIDTDKEQSSSSSSSSL